MTQRGASGRSRVVVMVVLVAAIGTLGALLVPRLLDGPKHDALCTVRGEISFALAGEGGLPHAGTIRVVALLRGRLQMDVLADFEAGAEADVVEGLLAREARSRSHEGAERVGHALAFAEVEYVGGDPGATGLAMSCSVSSRTRDPFVLRLGLQGDAPPAGATIHVVLAAYEALATDAPRSSPATLSLRLEGSEAGTVLGALAAKLAADGWTTAAGGAPGEELLIRQRPDGGHIGSAILTVRYEGLDEASPYLWRIGAGT